MDERPSLIHIVHSNTMGGVQSYALDICRHYRDKGWNVLALTRGAAAIDRRFAAVGIPMLHAPVGGYLDLASARILAGALRKLPPGPCIIHVHRYRDAFTALLAKTLSKRGGVRVVSTRHAVRRGRDSFFFRFLYKKVNAHVFVSDIAYERFCDGWMHRRIPLPDNSVFILRNSLNIKRDAPMPEPERGPMTVLYFGPVVPGKGIETLIDALPLLRKSRLRLIIAGRGKPDFLDSMRQRAITRDVMDMIDWHSDTDDCEELMARSHFGVAPSVEREAFGMSSLRFMAYGRAQICTGNGAPTEYLRDNESALFVKPADAGELAEAILRLARDPELRMSLGARAFDDYSRLMSWDIFTRNLDRIYIPSAHRDQ